MLELIISSCFSYSVGIISASNNPHHLLLNKLSAMQNKSILNITCSNLTVIDY